MKPLTIKVDINGRNYTMAELDQIYDERTLHVFTEMQALGAVILNDHGEVLTQAQIALLTAPQRRDLLLANKLRLGTDKLKALYADSMKTADEMWQDIVAHSNGQYNEKVARAHLVISGVKITQFAKLAQVAGDDPVVSLGANPEHFEVTNDATGQHGFETMGMYGEPTLMDLRMGIKNLPEPADHHYLKHMVGDSRLANDLEVVNAYAMHQVRPSLHGIEIASGAYFPSATPQALVDGHAIHLAIEFSNVFRALADK
ncbi:hypothetical protein [Lactiplantibacillus fabifermentans]|uniref:Uncharacterized protein n=2 Tax=Lactiplantibacillus fabifermentans TaxID=483011 RepID=A0A0R2NQG6_9LACO|nr:hypothetical protein [Lactiplantibacillus fabifermentans]ETY72827.1 hypothetical protein LFAB_15560 [Lactiplantibacillus fabifermentans T30PCM01]KRO27976.1 hypothetical protein DY78_GL002745 [Lactiplantibacillus fabifermentans DSM 21115]